MKVEWNEKQFKSYSAKVTQHIVQWIQEGKSIIKILYTFTIVDLLLKK